MNSATCRSYTESNPPFSEMSRSLSPERKRRQDREKWWVGIRAKPAGTSPEAVRSSAQGKGPRPHPPCDPRQGRECILGGTKTSGIIGMISATFSSPQGQTLRLTGRRSVLIWVPNWSVGTRGRSWRFSACMPSPVITTAVPYGISPFQRQGKPCERTDDSFVLASSVIRLSPTALIHFNEAALGFRECGLPCGLHSSLCTLHAPCSAVAKSFATTSATRATLGTGGWLGLTRRGLSPRKKTPSLLGAQGSNFQMTKGSNNPMIHIVIASELQKHGCHCGRKSGIPRTLCRFRSRSPEQGTNIVFL